jgi:hypothetical protein
MPVSSFKLRDDHNWKATEGYGLCVLEKGLIRFEYPSGWIVEAKDNALYLHDMEEVVEACDLGVSVFGIPGELLEGLDMSEVLRSSARMEQDVYFQSEPEKLSVPFGEGMWLEQHYVEREYKREARFRVALVKGPKVVLVSLNYWTSRAAVLEPIWDHVMGSLHFGAVVSDPTRGDVLQ